MCSKYSNVAKGSVYYVITFITYFIYTWYNATHLCVQHVPETFTAYQRTHLRKADIHI